MERAQREESPVDRRSDPSGRGGASSSSSSRGSLPYATSAWAKVKSKRSDEQAEPETSDNLTQNQTPVIPTGSLVCFFGKR